MKNAEILIVDDHAMDSEILMTLLKECGMSSTAISIPSNIKELVGEMPNLQAIFLDLEFPNFDGFDIRQQLNSIENVQGIPIIAYSVDENAIDRARKEGFHSFLGKPLDPSQFQHNLERILSGESVWEVP